MPEPAVAPEVDVPAAANPSFTGTFGVDEFIADANDRIVTGSAVIVLPGVLDAAGPE